MVVLICISLMINNVEHLFICLLATCISSLEKMSIQFFFFLINLFIFIYLFFGCIGSLLLHTGFL